MKIPSLSQFFSRTSPRVGWFAVGIKNDGVHFAHVKPGAKPQVQVCAFHAAENVTPALLEKLRKDARIAGFQFTTLLLPGEYQMLLVDAPNVPLEEMKTAIRWRVKDMLSYMIEDATLDVLRIPASKIAEGRPQSLYAIAAPNSTIQARVTLFEKAKINLNVIDIPEMAQRNIAVLFEEEGRGLALLAFDESGGLLTFTCDGELYLARRIEITLTQLREPNESQRQLSMERLELEMQRSMDYFGRQYIHITVARLLVSAPKELGLAQLLAPALDVPVEQLDLAQVLDISIVPELADSVFAAQAFFTLGAALRQERRIL
ncbi:MAG: agglutinin biogenesis protein MshI [Pseudomonadota bacterium]